MSYFTTVKQGINKFLISRLRRRNKVKDNDLTIISNNCIAGVLYHDNDMKFNTPTINLFIKRRRFCYFLWKSRRFFKLQTNRRKNRK